MKIFKIFIPTIAATLLFVGVALATCGGTFPTSLNACASNDIVTEDLINDIETKLGIDSSADSTSIDYLIKNSASKLGSIANITATDGVFVVADGTKFVGESGATARTSMGLGSSDSVTFSLVNTGQGANELYPMDQSLLSTVSPTFDGITLSGLTASELISTNASSKLQSLAVATYPSLIELAYVKGVTSAIQTQLGLKAPLASPTFTGTFTFPTGLTGVIRADTGVASVDTDITDLVSASSLTLAGKVELSTTAEIDTGTDSTRAMPVDQFVASKRNVRYVLWRVVGDTSDWPANATLKQGGDLEFPFTGTITEIGAFVDTAGTTGTAVVDVNLGGTTIMTTNKLSFDTTEKTTRTAATAPTLTTTAITAGDILTVDIDTNHTTKSKGLTIRIGVRQ